MYISSVQSRNVLKNKRGPVKKVIGVKRASSSIQNNREHTQLTPLSILLTDIAFNSSTLNIAKKKNIRGRSVRKLVKQKTVSNRTTLSTNRIDLNSSIRVTRSKSSSSVGGFEHVGTSGKRKQILSVRKISIATKGTKNNELKRSLLYGNTPANLSPVAGLRNRDTQKTKALVEDLGSVKTSNTSAKLKKTERRTKEKSKITKQIKSRLAAKSHVTHKSSTQFIDTFLSSTTLRHGMTEDKIGKDTSTMSLHVDGLDIVNEKGGTARLRKSKTGSCVTRYVKQQSYIKKVSKEPRQTKTAAKSKTRNLKTPRTSFRKLSKMQASLQTTPTVEPDSRKSGLHVNKFLNDSTAGVEDILDFIGLDKFEKNKKSASKGRNKTKRGAALVTYPKQRKSDSNLSSYPLLPSQTKSAAVVKTPLNLQCLNDSSNVLNTTKVANTNSNNIERPTRRGKKVRRETRLLHKKKQKKTSDLVRKGNKRSLHSRKFSTPAKKNTLASSATREKKKKSVAYSKKLTVVDIPVIAHKRPHSCISDCPPSKKPRISHSPLLVAELKPSLARKKRSPSHLEKRTHKSLARMKENIPSESQLNRRSKRKMRLEKENSSLVVTRIATRKSVTKKSKKPIIHSPKMVHKNLPDRKQDELSQTEKDVKKKSIIRQRKSSSLLSPAGKKVSSESSVSIHKRSLEAKSSLQETAPWSVLGAKKVSSSARKEVNKVQRRNKSGTSPEKQKTRPSVSVKRKTLPAKSVNKLSPLGDTQIKNASVIHGSINNPSKKKSSILISPVKIGKSLPSSKYIVKKNSAMPSKKLKVNKFPPAVSSKKGENKSRLALKKLQIDAVLLLPSKRRRVLSSASVTKEDKSPPAAKKMSSHIMKATTKNSTRNKINKKRQHSTSESPLHRISSISLQSEKLMSPSVVSKKAVAKITQKSIIPSPKRVRRNMPDVKQDELTQTKKDLKKISIIMRKPYSNILSPAGTNIYSQSSIHRTSLEAESPLQRTAHVPILVRKKISSSARKGVNKLSAVSKQKTESVTSLSSKKESKSSSKRKQKSTFKLMKVTPKQLATRKKSKSTLNKISNTSLQLENNLLSPTKRRISKQPASKLSPKSVRRSQKSILAGKQTEPSQLKKDVTRLSGRRQLEYPSCASPTTKKTYNHSGIRRFVVIKLSSKVTGPKSVAVEKRISSSPVRKGIHAASIVAKQKKLTISSSKKKTPKPSVNSLKMKKYVSPITNKVTESSSLDEHFEREKNGRLQTKSTEKHISLVIKKGRPQKSFRKKNSLLSPSKIKTLSPSKILLKKISSKTSRVKIGKYVQAMNKENTFIKDTKLENVSSPQKKWTAKQTSGKMVSNKKNPKLPEKIQFTKLLPPTTKQTRMSRSSKIVKTSLVYPEQKNLTMAVLCKKQLQATSSASPTKMMSQIKKKVTKQTPNKMFSQSKSLNLSTNIEARRSLSLTPRTKLSNASELKKINVVSPRQRKAAKPLLDKELILETTSFASLKTAGRKPVSKSSDQSKEVESEVKAHNVSFQKTRKDNRIFEKDLSSWQNITSVSPVHLTTKFGNHERESSSIRKGAVETSSRIIDTIYTRQTKYSPSTSWETKEVSPAKTVCIELGRKTLSSSTQILDATPSSEERSESRYTRHDKISPGDMSTVSHITSTSCIKKEQVVPSLVENTTDSLPVYTMNISSVRQKKNVLASEEATSLPVMMAEDYTRYTLHSPYSVQTKSTASSTLLDHTKHYGQDITDISSKQPPFLGRQHLTADTRSCQPKRRPNITSSFDSEDFNIADYHTMKRNGIQLEYDKESDINQEDEESEGLEESIYEDMNLEQNGRYDSDAATVHSVHSQRCSIS